MLEEEKEFEMPGRHLLALEFAINVIYLVLLFFFFTIVFIFAVALGFDGGGGGVNTTAVCGGSPIVRGGEVRSVCVVGCGLVSFLGTFAEVPTRVFVVEVSV